MDRYTVFPRLSFYSFFIYLLKIIIEKKIFFKQISPFWLAPYTTSKLRYAVVLYMPSVKGRKYKWNFTRLTPVTLDLLPTVGSYIAWFRTCHLLHYSKQIYIHVDWLQQPQLLNIWLHQLPKKYFIIYFTSKNYF